MTTSTLTARALASDAATGLFGSALFGMASAAGHGARAMAQGAWVAPALFVGGAALATPPLYLFGALAGGRASVATTLSSTTRSLARVSTALVGLSAPALYLSVTMHTVTGRALLVATAVVVGTAGVIAVLSERLGAERADGARAATLLWLGFALLLGARLISSLGQATGLFGGA